MDAAVSIEKRNQQIMTCFIVGLLCGLSLLALLIFLMYTGRI